jgi:hypothetical protein
MALTPDEFTLLDDHKPQKIARFREVDGHAFSADLHVIVALYAVNDGGSAIGHIAIGHMRRDLGKFLSQGSGPLEYPTLALPFTHKKAGTNHLIQHPRRRNFGAQTPQS